MLLLSQIREELALYFELIGTPKTAAEKAIRDRIVTLHNELIKIETVAAVVPVEDIRAVVSCYNKTSDGNAPVPPASFGATIAAVEALIEARTPKPPETPATPPAEPAVPTVPVEIVD